MIYGVRYIPCDVVRPFVRYDSVGLPVKSARGLAIFN